MRPDARNKRDDPAYLREVVAQIKARHGLSQRATAARLGIGQTTLKDWLAGRAGWRYPDQYALERLAQEGEKQ